MGTLRTVSVKKTFLSTLSLRRATADISTRREASKYFYPRSPCGERRDVIAEMTEAQSISIHALLAESDIFRKRNTPSHNPFLSTLSLRRATGEKQRTLDNALYFYPRSPCGERPWARGSRVTYVEFLSTLSLRRATWEHCER